MMKEPSIHINQDPQRGRTSLDRRAKAPPSLVDRFLGRLRRARSAFQARTTWLQPTIVAPQWLPARWRHPLIGYLLAFLIAVGAASLTLLLVILFPAFDLEGVLLLVGIVIIALAWGAGPGMLATVVSVGFLGCVFLPLHLPWQLQDPTEWVDVVVLFLSGMGISLLASQSGRERRRAEALASSLSEAKAMSEREHLRLRTVLEVLPVGVFLADATGRYVDTNPAFRAIWGESSPLVETISQYGAYKGWWPGTDQRVAPEDWALARALQEEIDIETFDGQHKTILNFAVPMREATGSIAGGVVTILDISERKHMEEALRQAEHEAAARAGELEAIFEAMTDGLLVYDTEGRILRSNRAARQLLGFDAHPEFFSLPWKERAVRYAPLDAESQPSPPEHLALYRLLHGEVLTGAQAAEDRLHTPDGRLVSFSMTGRPLRDAEGAIIGAVGIARDVTERRRLEREAAEHAAQLETIFESIADGVVVTDRHKRVLHMNRAFRTLLGLEQDPTGWTLFQLEELAGFESYTPAGQHLINGTDPIAFVLQDEGLNKQQSVDTILRTREGRETQVNTTGAPIRDATGQIIGSVLVARDVTEQRRLEQQTREALDALLAMAEALVHVPDRPPGAGKCFVPEENEVARHLAALTRSVLGFEHVSMVAVAPGTEMLTPITVVNHSPEDEQAWWARWNRTLHLGDALPPRVVAALQMGRPVRLEHWLQGRLPERAAFLVPMRVGQTLVGVLRLDREAKEELYSDQNKPALISAVAQLGALVLEHERLQCERVAAQANEQALRETNAHMDTFLGMAGHELKTPLTSIKLSLQLAERRMQRLVEHETVVANDGAPLLELLAHAQRQVERLNRLVNDLLNLSRVRVGKLDLHLEPTDLAVIVREAVEEQRQANPARTLVVQFPADQRVPITADADRIGQVVINYLTNALKYSPAVRPVVVGIDVADHEARVWVRDQGPGLPAEEQERIWERFHQVKEIKVQSGSGVGLGLGLHICRTIIERHQGQVGVESAPGQGSTFWFILPLARTQSA